MFVDGQTLLFKLHPLRLHPLSLPNLNLQCIGSQSMLFSMFFTLMQVNGDINTPSRFSKSPLKDFLNDECMHYKNAITIQVTRGPRFARTEPIFQGLSRHPTTFC